MVVLDFTGGKKCLYNVPRIKQMPRRMCQNDYDLPRSLTSSNVGIDCLRSFYPDMLQQAWRIIIILTKPGPLQ